MKTLTTVLGSAALAGAAAFSLTLTITQFVSDYMRLAVRASSPGVGF